MRRGVLIVALLLAACSTKYIKFPAEEYLVGYWKDRMWLQDETVTARRRCARLQTVVLAPGTGVPVPTEPPAKLDILKEKCQRLEERMAAAAAQDLQVIQASLKGDTLDPATLQAIQTTVGPLLDLAKFIAAF